MAEPVEPGPKLFFEYPHMARSTNEQNKTQNCNTRKASQKATQSTTQKTTNSTTDCGCGCGTKGKDDGSKKK